MSQLDETCDDDRLLAAVKEFTHALEVGEPVTIEAFVAQHTDIGDELRSVLEGLLLVHGFQPAAAPPRAAESPPGEFTARPIGDFQILSELGRGGMGIVYEAVQLSLGRRVALKVLPFASGLDEVRLQRFHNEAHAAAALHHTNIVPVYAVGADRGVHYYAMQLIEGQTLAEIVSELRRTNPAPGSAKAPTRHSAHETSATRDGLASPAQADTAKVAQQQTNQLTLATNAERNRHYRTAVRMILDASLAIEHAHNYGVVHRDVKPANLIRDRAGKIWVTDFGLAQIESDATQLTRTGDPLGTLRYMSPEQASGNRTSIDHRTDIYSLGATLYELLTLHPAFDNDNYRALLNEVVEKEPPPMRSISDSIPPELETIVRTAMAKSPGDRYVTAEAFAQDLQAWLDDKPIAARSPTLLERLNKWRRRNSGLVAAAVVILLVTSVALATTTLIVLSQQALTRQALDEQTRQRRLAEENLDQARAAVDAFSELSERELAYRPDLQDLRREFLETSLGFYQEFLDRRSVDEELSDLLNQTSTQVQRMVRELDALDRVQPLLLLSDQRVQQELGLAETEAQSLAEAVESFRTRRESLANQNVGGLLSDNRELSELISELDQQVSSQLSADQLERLTQIHRQRWLPFSFKSREMVRELELSHSQLSEINRIIEVTRPHRLPPPGNDRRLGLDGFPPGRAPHGHGLDRPGPPPKPPLGFDAGPGGRPDRLWNGPPPGTDRTVREILTSLTPEQRLRWQALVGEPFWFRW